MSIASIGLYHPKHPVNVGAVMRAAKVYGAASVAAVGSRYRKAGTDTVGAIRSVPLLQVDDLRAAIPYGCVPVAVDIVDVAVPLPEYEHPECAYYVFGPEDGTLGKQVLTWCRDKVYVPGNGCMNLAATVNVVLYDRLAKMGRS